MEPMMSFKRDNNNDMNILKDMFSKDNLEIMAESCVDEEIF